MWNLWLGALPNSDEDVVGEVFAGTDLGSAGRPLGGAKVQYIDAEQVAGEIQCAADA